ncbi:hypothetical protein GLYMA_13G289701v4 [Glycine max]|nr:hypothetical protein GLYMA_13G289701v4 [Glycine max]KAH1103919.1 hypothetical protein GYH30_037710 [Glycine max]
MKCGSRCGRLQGKWGNPRRRKDRWWGCSKKVREGFLFWLGTSESPSGGVVGSSNFLGKIEGSHSNPRFLRYFDGSLITLQNMRIVLLLGFWLSGTSEWCP